MLDIEVTLKQVVIHAGPGKTGTSAIQSWLSSNSATLRQHGVMYPNHATDVNEVSSGNLNAILREEQGEWVVCERKIALLLEKFERSEDHTLLLSSEFFFYQIQNIARHIPDCRFIVYLRDPLDLIESGYNQSVKRHRRATPLKLTGRQQNHVIQHLSQLLRSSEGIHLEIRPYHSKLFDGGNITSDLLRAAGLKLSCESRTVNPSYTFEALEFKRQLNHFPLGGLEFELDKVLQSFHDGTSNFTLFSPELRRKLSEHLYGQLEAFVEEFEQKHLVEFLKLLREPEEKKYLPQCITTEQLYAVANYIEQVAPELLIRLRDIVQKYNYIHLPDNLVFDFFCVTPEKRSVDMDVVDDAISNIREAKDTAEFCRELALLLEKGGSTSLALAFMERAHELRPKGGLIQQKLNQFRVEVYDPDTPQRRGIENLKKRLTKFLKTIR